MIHLFLIIIVNFKVKSDIFISYLSELLLFFFFDVVFALVSKPISSNYTDYN